MKVKLPIERKARIEMLPLIDIVFLLLVFFIYSMLSMAVHRSLPIDLPKSSTAEIDTSTFLSITVEADGTVYVDKVYVPLDELSDYLARQDAAKREKGVLLFGEHTLSYQRLFRVLDQIRLAGIDRVSMQAEQDE